MRIVLFYSNSCGHCVREKPLIQEVAKRYHATLIPFDVNDSDPEVQDRVDAYNVSSIPAVFLFSDDSDKLLGTFRNASTLEAKMREQLQSQQRLQSAQKTLAPQQGRTVQRRVIARQIVKRPTS